MTPSLFGVSLIQHTLWRFVKGEVQFQAVSPRQINDSNEATMITVDNQKQAVLVSVNEWNSIQETLYLLSIPGVKDDLIEG
ncbi:type II toxin-antitoxin system Phd/YefM family antitoxin [Crocosphaera chwakensis]|uniref:Antitoxin n=1 Tax=Crocosphaera chwakensis CCY0110 TaxID=391612 RepID=A3IP40_9CHRO|nr:type II toxin-antitoxin system Phd/YefM family antitoxin [Crocosphaera chwakensis]EAZ91842.1 hypothetical protein CY0110_07774 [Crocosphaera chwakensis CCY0110]